ncbi:MAG: 1-deoxy-D-xylulose-5-phosphate synthase [Bacilli bacterium]|nr:1-deoxy-D-xylulose-5-phosphate synthase [Bacilli bacterium]
MSKSKVNKVKHINLNEIKDPSFLKNLSYSELDVLADDIRKEIIRCTAKNGGHLSSNLGVVELTIAIEHFFDLSKDKLIFDVGHQCYTHKILTGRPLENLRQTNGISGFQKIDESVYDCFDAGHSSTSLSAANGFAIARDLKGENYNVIALIGDGSISSGLAFEGLNNLATGKHKVVIIINDNGMSISKPVGALSKTFGKLSTAAGYNRIKYGYRRVMVRTKVGKKIYNLTLRIKNWFKRHLTSPNIFSDIGFAYIGPVDGHNIRKLEKAFKRVSNTEKSVVLHVCTTKGKGYELAENDIKGSWHGVAPFKVQDGEPLKSSKNVTWSKVFAELSLEEMEKHQDAFLISPATTVGAEIDEVLKQFPERSLDVGIAEEHAATLSGGLSRGGFHPIISIYSTFMQRAYDEIAHDMARTKANATILVDRAGLVGRDGETHQGIYDAAFLSTIPGVVITMPSSRKEAEFLYDESFNNHGVFAIRYPRATCLEEGKDEQLSFGKWLKLRESKSKKVAVIGVGHLVRELDHLVEKEGLDCTIYNALFINPIDEEALSSLKDYDKIVIYDAYSTQGGLVSLVTLKLSQMKFRGLISAYCVPNVFVKQATITEQLESFGLLPEQIIEHLK